ncbi:MAG: FkbM family methyltransferase [Candidatus Omnitrophica bacterium]|nr:FkbM family methyltransferase [Candidatus Omnitrophota bacterium]
MKKLIEELLEGHYILIDVGSMGGIATKWDVISKRMKVIAFEPDDREFTKLKSTDQVVYLNYALYENVVKQKYYVSQESGKSSCLRPNFDVLEDYPQVERFKVISTVDIPEHKITTLDKLFSENVLEDADFIKLDTQGTELFILKGGAEECLSHTFGIQCEVEFLKLYTDQPVFRDVDGFLDEKGFTLIDIRRQYWKRKTFFNYGGKGQLVFGDALYFKHVDIWIKYLKKLNDLAYAKDKLRKSIVTCLVYGVYDYAGGIVDLAKKEGLLSDAESREYLKIIAQAAKKNRILRFWLFKKGYRLFKRLLDIVYVSSFLGWADSDRKIGNIDDE